MSYSTKLHISLAKPPKTNLNTTLLSLSLLMSYPIFSDELRTLQNTPDYWVSAAGNYNNQRYSKLDEVTKANVNNLKMAWSFSTGVLRGHEGNSLILGDTLYVHTPFPNIVYALDLNNDGAIRWKYQPEQSYDETVPVMCCDTVNRGLAYADGKIFLAQADTSLVALDSETGDEVWSTKRDDPKRGATSTGAVHVFKDKVLVGISGSEFGIRGYIDVFSLDGHPIYRVFSTGPDNDILFDPETTTSLLRPVGHDSSIKSWQGDQWKIGGGSTWGWFSYDPDLDSYYYGSANPSTWNPIQRPGDNKWTMSIFSRDLETGVANWVYQMTPHDEWDYDGVNENILVDQHIQHKRRKTLVHFDRNGFAYTLDRRSGELLVAQTFDKSVNWSKGVSLTTGLHDRVNRYSPDFNGEDEVTEGICPAALGSKDQQPAAYSPRTGLFYVPTNHLCMDYEPFEVEFISGQPFVGASVHMYPVEGDAHLGNFIAWNAREGKIVWSKPERFSIWSGALTTASNLVFYGTLEGYIKALDAHTGRELWRFKTPSGIIGNVNTYKHNNRQYISILSGVGGWAGIGMAIPELTQDSDGDGAVGAYRGLFNWTNLGGVLSVFSL